MPERTSKIAIIGAGSVGATIAYACLIRGVGRQIVLQDINLPVPMSPAEEAGLRQSAEAIRATIRSLGF